MFINLSDDRQVRLNDWQNQKTLVLLSEARYSMVYTDIIIIYTLADGTINTSQDAWLKFPLSRSVSKVEAICIFQIISQF